MWPGRVVEIMVENQVSISSSVIVMPIVLESGYIVIWWCSTAGNWSIDGFELRCLLCHAMFQLSSKTVKPPSTKSG